MKTDWLSALAEQGTPHPLSGNSPLLLDDLEQVWLVRAGRV